MPRSPAYSLWLLLPPDVDAIVRPSKARIDHALGGADFVLHLTVAGAFDLDGPAFSTLCRSAIEAARKVHSRFEIVPTGYETGDSYFQSLYVCADVAEALHQLRSAVYAAAGDAPPAFMPHISLYYGDAPQADKDRALRTLPAVPQRFHAHQFAIASNANHPMSWEIVERF